MAACCASPRPSPADAQQPHGGARSSSFSRSLCGNAPQSNHRIAYAHATCAGRAQAKGNSAGGRARASAGAPVVLVPAWQVVPARARQWRSGPRSAGVQAARTWRACMLPRPAVMMLSCHASGCALCWRTGRPPMQRMQPGFSRRGWSRRGRQGCKQVRHQPHYGVSRVPSYARAASLWWTGKTWRPHCHRHHTTGKPAHARHGHSAHRASVRVHPHPYTPIGYCEATERPGTAAGAPNRGPFPGCHTAGHSLTAVCSWNLIPSAKAGALTHFLN